MKTRDNLVHHHAITKLLSVFSSVSLALIILSFSISRAHGQTTLQRFTARPSQSPIVVVRGEGNLDGDGVVDIITAGSSKLTGTGVAAHSGATGKKIWDYELRGAVVPRSAAIGDIDGDGYDDVVLGTYLWFMSGDDPDSVIVGISGRTGAELFRFQPAANESNLGREVEVLNLDGAGNSSFLITASEKRGDRNESKLVRYTYVEGLLFEDCSYHTGLVNTISDIHTIPDFDDDGRSDVIFGMADLDNGALKEAGALFIMSSGSCEVVQVVRGPLAGGRFGEYFSAISDWNGDGVEDIGVGWSRFLSLHSGKDFASFNKIIAAPTGVNITGPIRLLPDMNRDGVADFGAIAIDPSVSTSRRAVFLSGQDNAMIGNFSLNSFAPTEDRWRLSRDVAGLLPSFRTDVNKDGVNDVAFFVRSYYDPYGNPLEIVSPNAEISIISGTCPRDVEINFLNTPAGAHVEAGVRPIAAKATACGVDLPGTLVLDVGGVKYQMYDSGENGDEVKGDNVYTAQARLAPGENTLKIKADVTNTVPLSTEKSVKVTAAYNYEAVVKKTFEWIEPADHDLVTLDSYHGVKLRMPFAFPFYGRLFSEMFVSVRGIILPSYPDNVGKGTTPRDLEVNKRLPSTLLSDPAIAVAWGFTTFYEKSFLYAKTLGSAGNQRFVLTFEGIEFQQDRNIKKSRLDYQIVFHEATKDISVNYKIIYSTEQVDDQGFSVTMGLQAGSQFGVTFSHKNRVVRDPLSIAYVPIQADGGDNGGGNGGGGGDNGGGNGNGDGNGGGGGDNGGGNGDGNGGGDTGGGNPGGDGTGGGNNQVGTTFKLAFLFAQGKAGARLTFDLQASNENAKQALTDCKFLVFGGAGLSGESASYQPLGAVSSGSSSKVVALQRFSQPVLTPKASKRSGKSSRLYLRAGASCPATGLNLISTPIQLKTSKRKGALTARRWFARLASELR